MNWGIHNIKWKKYNGISLLIHTSQVQVKENMRISMLFCCLYFVECIIPKNILISVIDTFQLGDVIIQNNCFTLNHKTGLLKIFSAKGKLINLNGKRYHQFHSFIFCPDNINNFSLSKQIKSQVVVIGQIENQNYLNEVNVSVGEIVYFLDKSSLKVYEAYIVNRVHITRYLG